MNDYLTNLAARSVDPAPALQPRLHSQFEPGPRIDVFNAAQSQTALAGEAVFTAETVEAENELPPVRARHNPNHHTRETIAPAAHSNESIEPVPRETPVAPQELLINSFEAVQKGETVLRQAQHERENRTDFGASSVRPESPPTQFILSEVEGLRTSFDKPRTGSVEGWTEGFSTASQPREKVTPSSPAFLLLDTVRPLAAMPDEAAVAVHRAEAENELPPFRARHNPDHHVRKSIAPAASINESIVPALHETPATPQPTEITSEKSNESVIASPSARLRINSAKQSLPEKEIASSPVVPRNDIYRTFQTSSKKLLINSLEAVPTGATVLRQAQHERENHSDLGPSSVHPELVEGWMANFSTASKKVAPSSPAFPPIGAVRPHPANPTATAADSRAGVTPSLPETVKARQTEIPSLPLPRKNDTESPRLTEERRTQTIRREQLVVTEVMRQREPERDSISPQATVTELPPKAHEHPQERPAAVHPIIAQPRIVPHFENRHDDRLGHSDDREAPPTPTIHVTIGRIEVRAAQPTSSSSPKRRQAPPVMSLDEYLRRRSNGGVG